MDATASSPAPPPRRQRRRPPARDEAAGNVISYLVGVGIFFAIFAVAISYLGIFAEPATSQSDVDLDSKARNLITVLTESTGIPSDWETQTSNLKRLGLRKPGTEITLSKAKIEALQPGGGVTYDEAKDALGLDNHEFNLRGEPKFSGDDNRTALEGYRLGYIGNFEESGTETGTSKAESGTFTETAVTYNNTTATTGALASNPGDKFKDLAPFLQRHLSLRLAGLWHNEDDKVDTAASSVTYWRVIDTSVHPRDDLDGDHRNVLATSNHSSGTWSYTDGEDDRVYAIKVNLSDYDSDDTIWLNMTHGVGGSGSYGSPLDHGEIQSRPVDANDLTAWNDETETNALADEGLVDNGSAQSFVDDTFIIEEAKGENSWISFLWDTQTGDADNQTGWFIADWTLEGMRDGTPEDLASNSLDYKQENSRYDVLAVGQGVEDGQLSENQPKEALKQWIKEGGDIVGLPPHDQGSATEWLDPWLSGPTEDNGPLTYEESSSNTTHAFLTSLHTLDYEDWPWRNEIWGIEPSDQFTWVVSVTDADGQVEPGLAVSQADATGDGNIILSSVDTTGLDPQVRRNNFENHLAWARYGGLFLELGDDPGEGHTVGSAKAVTLVDSNKGALDHPNYELFVNVWR